MKQLVKLAKTNKRLPLLKNVRVENGYATSSYIGTFITTPTTIANGLYHAEGFDLGLFNLNKTAYKGGSFPTLNLGRSIGGITLDLEAIEKLKWVSLSMSNEETCYYLNGICFNENNIVATDGHRLNMWNVSEKLPVNGVIIPKLAIKIALDLVKEKKAKFMHLKFYKNYADFQIGDTTLTTKLIDGTFPDVQRVIPQNNKHEFDYKSDFIRNAYKEIKCLQNIINISGITLEKEKAFLGEKTWETGLNFPVRIKFNAAYLNEIMDGKMYMNDARSPVKVVNGDRLSVLMPMSI